MSENTNTTEPMTEAAASLAPEAIASPAEAALEALAQLEQTQQKLAETQDAFLRAKAETENVRRRAQAEVSAAHKFALESFSGDLISVVDSLEAAIASTNATAESMRSGVELTLRQLMQVFEKHKVAAVNPVGEKFDPHKHQAISMVDAVQPANTVVSVLQKGYVLNDRVLRPAMVSVSNGKGAPSEETPPSS